MVDREFNAVRWSLANDSERQTTWKGPSRDSLKVCVIQLHTPSHSLRDDSPFSRRGKIDGLFEVVHNGWHVRANKRHVGVQTDGSRMVRKPFPVEDRRVSSVKT